jgi:nitroimidazol reductase NimA-like FMN-containing flavoprotein (pyridoxamine 5'-phosphate oxidase superfamily)
MASLEMSPEELDRFLDEERVLRLATLDEDGWPAVVPVWFVWHEGAFWVWNLTRARRTRRLEEGTRCAFVVDGGEAYVELRGASGRADHAFVEDDAVPVEVRRRFSQRYFGTDHPLEPASHHRWIRFDPLTLASWDFRKRYGADDT